MHRHDEALIAALATGDLPDAEADEARRAIASCSSCRQDLAAQELVRQHLLALGSPTLTDFERTRLHHVIDQQTPRRWYVRLAPAMAVAAAFVLVAGLGLGLLRTTTGEHAEQAAAPTLAETAPAAVPPAEVLTGVEEPAAADESPEQESALVDFGEVSREDLGLLVESLESRAYTLGDAEGPPAECADTAGEGAVLVGTGSLEGSDVEIYRFDDEHVAAFALPSCELLAESP